MKIIIIPIIGSILLTSLFGGRPQKLIAERKQLLSEVDVLLKDAYFAIDGKDEFETFKEYLQRVFKALPLYYDDQYRKLNEKYHKLMAINIQLDDLYQGKQTKTIDVTLKRYIAEKNTYLMDVSIKNISLGEIEAEIEREDAQQLKRNWENVQKAGYLKYDNLGDLNPSHFQLTNPSTGFVFTHFFDNSAKSSNDKMGYFQEKVQLLKVPFYTINPGEKVRHQDESMMYIEENGTFYIQIVRNGLIYNIIDGIEYGPYVGATYPTFENDGWYFYAEKHNKKYKIIFDILGATEIEEKKFTYYGNSKNQQINEERLYGSKEDQFTVRRNTWGHGFDYLVTFRDRSYHRTGSVSTDSKYDEWAMGVYNTGFYFGNGQGPHLRTSYGTFEPDSWNIGFIKINDREFYCFGTIEGQTITLNFPIRFSFE